MLFWVNMSCHELSLVKHALLGFQHVFPQLRCKLATCWENLKVWEEQRATKLRPPLPVPLWLFMVGLARAHAKVAEDTSTAHMWRVFSVLLEIGLLCMLRPGELVKLCHTDVCLPGSFTLCQNHAALRVVSPKNRRQFGEHQFVLLKHANAVEWLRSIHDPSNAGTLWPCKKPRFAALFKQLAGELGIKNCGFTPSSLRPGGATMFYNIGVPIASSRFMGRWSVERSLERYVQLAMATQILNRLAPRAVSRLKRLASLCLLQVPSKDWTHQLADSVHTLRNSPASQLLNWCNTYVSLA